MKSCTFSRLVRQWLIIKCKSHTNIILNDDHRHLCTSKTWFLDLVKAGSRDGACSTQPVMALVCVCVCVCVCVLFIINTLKWSSLINASWATITERERERRERERAQTALETMSATDKAGGWGNCFHKIMNELQSVWRNRKSPSFASYPFLCLSLYPWFSFISSRSLPPELSHRFLIQLIFFSFFSYPQHQIAAPSRVPAYFLTDTIRLLFSGSCKGEMCDFLQH